MSKRRLRAFIPIMAIALVLAACSSDSDDGDGGDAGDGLIVGVSWNNFQEERWAKSDEPAIRAVLDAAGVEYISTDAGSSAEQQLTDIEDLITLGADVLIILAQDGTAVLPGVQSALDQGIPVIAYDRLIEDTRAQVERNYRRTPGERLVRRLAFAIFTHPAGLRALIPPLILGRLLGLTRLATRLGSASRVRALAMLAPQVRFRDTVARLEPRWEAKGDRRGTVGLLQGCVQRAFFGRVNVASAEVLAAEGFAVEQLKEQGLEDVDKFLAGTISGDDD